MSENLEGHPGPPEDRILLGKVSDPPMRRRDVAGELRAIASECNRIRHPFQMLHPMWRGQPLSNTLFQLAEWLEAEVREAEK